MDEMTDAPRQLDVFGGEHTIQTPESASMPAAPLFEPAPFAARVPGTLAMLTTTCERCGRPFVSSLPGQKFCGAFSGRCEP